MPVFVFEARSSDGMLRRGTVTAENMLEAKVKLRTSQLVPINVRLKSQVSISAKKKSKKIKPKELQTFTRQFAVLTGAGVPIVQGLQALNRGGGGNPVLYEAIEDILEKLEQGKTLSGAMEDYPTIFDKIYTQLVAAGETSGSLDLVLNRLAEYIEKANKLAGKVKGALVYPAVILVVSGIVISAIMIFVIPAFTEMFESSGQELPKLTQIVVLLSDGFIKYWYLVFSVFIGIPLILKSYFSTKEGKRNFDSIILKVPLMGSLVLKSCVARFTRTLAILITAGVRLADALDIASVTAGNFEIERVLIITKESIIQGKTFSEPLKNSKLIPEMVSQMIGIGEESGNLDIMLNKIADFYEEEVETAADTLTSLIEPFMMVFLGGIIAILVVAMYLPVFNMANTVSG